MSTVDEDPIALRIARILESKARDNKEVLSALNVAEEAWERLNKEVDTSIGTEFDLLATERAAVLAAKERLDNPDEDPTDEGFAFTGRVSTARPSPGCPALRPRRGRAGRRAARRHLHRRGRHLPDGGPAERLDPAGSQTSVTVEVYTDPERTGRSAASSGRS